MLHHAAALLEGVVSTRFFLAWKTPSLAMLLESTGTSVISPEVLRREVVLHSGGVRIVLHEDIACYVVGTFLDSCLAPLFLSSPLKLSTVRRPTAWTSSSTCLERLTWLTVTGLCKSVFRPELHHDGFIESNTRLVSLEKPVRNPPYCMVLRFPEKLM